jgi:molecular chaperone DnaJ
VAEKDYYKILGVSKESTQEEIKKAFKQLARKYHPDVNPEDKDSEEKFKEINEAFQVLGNSQKKAKYDQYGTSAFNAEDFAGFESQRFNFDDLFSNLGFGDIFDAFNHRRGRGEDYEEGADLRYDLEITLEESFTGIKKIIEIPVHEVCKKCKGLGAEEKDLQECDKCHGLGEIRIIKKQGFTQFISVVPCDKCHGIGKIATKHCELCKGKGKIEKIQKIEIKIPKGINHGQSLRIEGKGELGRNAPSGDLYIVVHVKKHQIFKREEENLFLDKKIDLATAIFGGKIEIRGIDKKIKLKIPLSTQSHTPFKLEGQGMPFVNSRERGNLFVRVIVDIPKISKDKEKNFKKFFEF